MDKMKNYKNRKIENPQEIELWIILPAIKRQIANTLIKKHKLKQNEVAKLLNITPSAVSQYINNKRGNGIKFEGEALREIEKSTDRIAEKKDQASVEIISLIRRKEIQRMVCKIHKNVDPSFKDCKICS